MVILAIRGHRLGSKVANGPNPQLLITAPQVPAGAVGRQLVVVNKYWSAKWESGLMSKRESRNSSSWQWSQNRWACLKVEDDDEEVAPDVNFSGSADLGIDRLGVSPSATSVTKTRKRKNK